MIRTFVCALGCLVLPSFVTAASDVPKQWEPLVRVVDLNVGETAKLTLCDGTAATVKLVSLKEDRDDVCFAVRQAKVLVEVNGVPGT
ncbi:MAG: hypothetical protein KDA84_00845, partial [Planctomycetaceae bacterium]|nr:hypothetical protein [Planctomycetaceae bacterium]